VLGELSDRALTEARLEPFEPPRSDRIEGESLWPPIGQSAAYAIPRWAAGSCASASRWLGVATMFPEGRVTVALPSALAGRRLVPIVARGAGIRASIELRVGSLPVATIDAPPPAEPWSCERLEAMAVPAELLDRRVTLRLGGGWVRGRAEGRMVPLPAEREGDGPRTVTLALDALLIED
jgi:hypothetical protein